MTEQPPTAHFPHGPNTRKGKEQSGLSLAPRAEEAAGSSCEPQSAFTRWVKRTEVDGLVREGEELMTDL